VDRMQNFLMLSLLVPEVSTGL